MASTTSNSVSATGMARTSFRKRGDTAPSRIGSSGNSDDSTIVQPRCCARASANSRLDNMPNRERMEPSFSATAPALRAVSCTLSARSRLATSSLPREINISPNLAINVSASDTPSASFDLSSGSIVGSTCVSKTMPLIRKQKS